VLFFTVIFNDKSKSFGFVEELYLSFIHDKF
jgi:hypothetical protein